MKKTLLFSAAILFAAVTMAQTISSYTIDFKSCFNTNGVKDTIVGSCTTFPFMWRGTSITGEGQFVSTNHAKNVRGCDSIVTLTVSQAAVTPLASDTIKMCPGDQYTWPAAGSYAAQNITAFDTYTRTLQDQYGCDYTSQLVVAKADDCLPEGCLGGLFSVSSTQQVYFSQGNLQYRACESTTGDITFHTNTNEDKNGQWRFATNQWDYIGSANTNMSASYTGWIDLFQGGHNYYETVPYAWNPESGFTLALTGKYSDFDWGVYCAISNGENTPNKWRTLTAEEWDYLLGISDGDKRTNANTLCRLFIIHGVNGLAIFPDNWTWNHDGIPEESVYPNVNHNFYDVTDENWAAMAAAGAVFLPAAGRMGVNGNTGNPEMEGVNNRGSYWSSTLKPNSSGNALGLMTFFYKNSKLQYILDGYATDNASVRLVRNK